MTMNPQMGLRQLKKAKSWVREVTVYFELIYLEKPACFLNDGNEFPNQIVNYVYFTNHVYYSQANAITAMLLHNLPRYALLYRKQVHSKLIYKSLSMIKLPRYFDILLWMTIKYLNIGLPTFLTHSNGWLTCWFSLTSNF